MAEPTGYSVVEDENTDKERRVFLVRFLDSNSLTWKDGLDIYDSHNSLVEHIGYIAGDGHNSDRAVPLTIPQQRYMNRIFRLVKHE